MRRFENAAINSQTGLPIANPTITVFHDDGIAVATIYGDEGITTKANPFSGDAQGRFNLYAPDGDYVIKIEGAGVTAYQIQDVTIGDVKRGGFGVSDSLVSQFANAFYLRRTAVYNRIDTLKAAWNLELDATNDYLRVLRAAAAANPITWTELLRLTSSGHLLPGGAGQDLGATAAANRWRDMFLGRTLDIAQGTITVDTKAFTVTSTWNAALVSFVGFLMNITDTASAAASLLLDLQVGGASRFVVDKSGRAGLGTGINTGIGLHIKPTVNLSEGIRVQNNDGTFNESQIVLVEPLNDSGNALRFIMGSGAASGLEISVVRGVDSVRRVVGIDSSEWKWRRGSEATQLILNGSTEVIQVNVPVSVSRVLMNLLDNSVSKFKVEQTGRLILAEGIAFGGATPVANALAGPDPWSIYAAGSLKAMFATDSIYFRGDRPRPFIMDKSTVAAAAPGAGVGGLRWENGTTAGTLKLVAYSGTSTTGVTIVDNVGAGN